MHTVALFIFLVEVFVWSLRKVKKRNEMLMGYC